MKKTAKRPLTDEEIMAYDNVPIDVAARYIGWSSPTIYRALREEMEDGILVNLASAEYSRAVEKYLEPDVRYITCRFGRMEQGKFREKGVHVKMARGQMVRYLAECQAQTPADIKGFDRMGYAYCDALSDEAQYVFLQEKQPSQV